MRKSNFPEAQVGAALRECASGTPVGQVARRLGMSERRSSRGGPRGSNS
jgi:hypothetical protein